MDAEQEIRQPELSYLSFTYTVFVINFLNLVRSDEPFQTQLRRVDWARAGVYEYAVQETAKGIPNERRDDWDPEVVFSGGPHLGAHTRPCRTSAGARNLEQSSWRSRFRSQSRR